MTEPTVLPPTGTRTKLVISLAVLALMFLAGTRLNARPARVFETSAAVTSIIAGLLPALGSQRARFQRWLLLGSFSALAIMFGFAVRRMFGA
jgi:hypothetical protein